MSSARSRTNRVKYEDFNDVGYKTNEKLFSHREQAADDTLVVLVSHSFYSALPYIESCGHICGKDNLHLVMKTSSDNEHFKEHLGSQGYSISELNKRDFQTRPDRVIKEIKALLKEKGLKKVLLMDHGGYGSYHLQELSNELPISGIVEYTINGQNKYEEVFKHSPKLAEKIHYVSIGKSPLKHLADVSCGELIGQLTQQIVQEKTGFSIKLRDFTRVGIVGFGALGEAAADHLKQNGASNMMVYDVAEPRRTLANLKGYKVVENSRKGLHELLEKCDVVIVGTDKKPIDKEAFGHIKPNAVITGVTSADDTFDLPERIKDGTVTLGKKYLKGKVTELTLDDGKKIYTLYDGEAPNLAGSEIGVMDPSINLPTSLHTMIAWHVAKHGKIPEAEKVTKYEQEVNQMFNDAYAEAQETQRARGRN